jgi:hypothetical protein
MPCGGFGRTDTRRKPLNRSKSSAAEGQIALNELTVSKQCRPPRLPGIPLRLFALCLLPGAVLQAAAQPFSGLQSSNIYQRAAVEFLAADFYKPAEPGPEDLTLKLAPLLIQQVGPGGSKPAAGLTGQASEVEKRQDQFGALRISNNLPVIDRSRPTMYFEPGTVQIHGKLHTQLTFLWFYSVEPRGPVDRGLPCQAIRLTLDSGGDPVIWEVLADASGAELIFVSESVESAARADFGQPLPGRRYAVERRLEEAPRIVVARVIDDGPVPMGPFVYLSAGTRCVSTIICRCMPAQAKSLLAAHTYDLAPLQTAPLAALIPKTNAPNPAPFWPGDCQPRARLEDSLRLPKAF